VSASAHLLALGPYSPEIAEHLDYPPDHYEELTGKDMVAGTLFRVEARSGMEALAEIFHVRHPLSCFMSPEAQVHITDLYPLEGCRGADSLSEDWKSYQRLRRAGFSFLFRADY
jgi:hypothetical protein